MPVTVMEGTIGAMYSPIVTAAVFHVIRQAVFHVGECVIVMVDGQP